MRGLKSKEQGQWKKWGTFLLLFLILLLLTHSASNVYKKKKVAEETLVRMEKDTEELKNRDQVLKTAIARMATEDGLKFEMRKKLNVAEVGERVAIIVDDEETPTTTGAQISAWQKFKNFMLKWFK